MAEELYRRDGMALVRREGPSCLTEKDAIPFAGPGRLVHKMNTYLGKKTREGLR